MTKTVWIHLWRFFPIIAHFFKYQSELRRVDRRSLLERFHTTSTLAESSSGKRQRILLMKASAVLRAYRDETKVFRPRDERFALGDAFLGLADFRISKAAVRALAGDFDEATQSQVGAIRNLNQAAAFFQ